jgi:hypothetical protein
MSERLQKLAPMEMKQFKNFKPLSNPSAVNILAIKLLNMLILKADFKNQIIKSHRFVQFEIYF